MIRTLIAAAAMAACAALNAAPATAAAADAAPAAKKAAKPSSRKSPAKVAEPVSATNDSLNAGQLTAADRVLLGKAACEFRQTVEIEKIDGHPGNFRLTFDKKSYVMVPEETSTGAVRLVDTAGAVVWVQIPRKSMLMNQKEHHRMVDECQADEQRIAEQASAQAAANAQMLAPSVAGPVGPAAPAPSNAPAAAPSESATAATVRVVPEPAHARAPSAPDAASAGMWK